MLVERGNALRRQLAADPVRFLDQMDVASAAGGGERCGNAAGAAADNQDIAGDVARTCQVPHAHDGDGRDRRSRAPA